MPDRQCYHCKQWIEAGEAHDCWTTTEAALTAGLSEDLQDAWQRLRETATEFGEQRIYASHHSIMFSRRSCYFFVRPKRQYLELCVFLGRAVNAPQVRRIERPSSLKAAHVLRIMHRDEVEAPITDWLREAYAYASTAAVKSGPSAAAKRRTPRKAATGRRTKAALRHKTSAKAPRTGRARRASGHR